MSLRGRCFFLVPLIASLLIPTALHAAKKNAEKNVDVLRNMPSSRACVQEDLNGLFVMRKTYHHNADAVYEEIRKEPFRLIFFLQGGKLAQANSAEPFKDAVVADRMLRDSLANDKRQWLLTEQGVLYFYRNSEPEAGAYCFISAEDKGLIQRGNLMIQQALEGNKAQILKVYESHRFPTPKPSKKTGSKTLSQKELAAKRHRQYMKELMKRAPKNLKERRLQAQERIRRLKSQTGYTSPYKNRVDPSKLPGGKNYQAETN